MAKYDFWEKTIFLYAKEWFQSSNTERGLVMRLRGGMEWNRKQFIIPEVGDIAKLPLDLAFVCGPYDWKVLNAPTGCIGYLSFYASEGSDEFSSPAFLDGALSLPTAMFNDVWSQISKGRTFSGLWIKVGPTQISGYDDTVWDRQTQKTLFITEAEFTFRSKPPPVEQLD